jgi:hypothetical protein
MTQVTRNVSAPSHDAGVEQGTWRNTEDISCTSMSPGRSRFLRSLASLLSRQSPLKSTAESRGIARSAAVDLIDCNSHDPYFPSFAGSLGYPAGELFVAHYY